MMHLDTDQDLLRHTHGDPGDGGTIDSWFNYGTIPVLLCSLLLTLSMVVSLAMCVCRDKLKKGEQTPEEITPVNDRKSNCHAHQTEIPIEDTEVQVVAVNQRDSHHSNGSAVLVKESLENGRPKSHDHRALPEIPASGVLQTDDEEDDEGHYDIIRGRSKFNLQSDHITPTSLNTNGVLGHQFPNLYEKVGDTGSDSTYAGVKDDSSDPDYPALKNINPYATVEGIGNAEYAHIDEKSKKTHVRKPSGISRLQELQSSASIDTLDDSYASIPPPPVPDKHFTNSETSSTLTTGAIPSSPHKSHNSPGLPPRNRTSSSGTEGGVDGGNATLSDIMPSANGGDIEEDADVNDIMDDEVDVLEGPVLREPPYSSVTARESLANLRQRQAAELAMKKPLPHDATYESVNYDQITSTTNTGPGSLTSDRNSLASDLYAEIASGSGENSTRSSVYAKVGDVSNIRDAPAPTPPPVDILKQLSLPKGDEDMADPGYSVIRRSRPQSAYTASSNTPRVSVQDNEFQPVYAVVDKGRKNRNTVCISGTDMNENLPIHHSDINTGPQQLYAQVNKPRRPQNFTEHFPEAAYLGTGARPKMRYSQTGPIVNNNLGPGVSGVPPTNLEDDGRDPDYQTIPSDLVQSNDPNYDDILDNKVVADTHMVEFDPNYETVYTGSIPRSRLTSPGVATEIKASDFAAADNPHGMVHISNHHVDSNFWQKREHVYQEITVGGREREKFSDRFNLSTDL